MGLGLTLLAAGLLGLQPAGLAGVEEKLLDLRFKLRGALPAAEVVVIAAIDEKSLARLGRWPWNRDQMARLVTKLDEAGAALIVFDVIFSEAEANDPLLAEAIYEAGNVLLPVVFDFEQEPAPNPSPVLPLAAFRTIDNPENFRRFRPIEAHRVLLPVAMLLEDARGVGHINMFPERDGTLRREALIIAYDGRLYPSLALRAAAEYLEVPLDEVRLLTGAGVEIGTRRLFTDGWGRSLINYYGPGRTFPHYSISDILAGNLKEGALAGKVVLIGATAAGIYDLRVTPYAAAMPGVEKHASVIASIIDDRPLRAAAGPVNLLVLLTSGLFCTWLLARHPAVTLTTSVTGLGLLLLGAGAQLGFNRYGIWFNLTIPALNLLAIYTAVTGLQYALEEKHARRVRAMFASYVTERVVNELIRHPELARLGGERREVTVLFSDVRGFTSISEKHSPEEVVAILNEYLGEMTDIVFHWEGTLDKFIGDAIMVFWNAPMPQPDHAERAVRCALHMVARLEQLQEKWRAQGKPVLNCGIGLNSGPVLVGNIGAEGRKMDYTVIGDHVNLGARLESLTKKYQARILASEYTVAGIRPLLARGGLGHFLAIGRERVIVKGKEEPVTIYEITHLPEGEAAEIREWTGAEVVRLTEK